MADLSGLPIPKMDWESSNLPETWRKFQRTVELMFKGPLSAKEEEIHVTYLLLWVGEKGREIADTWTDMSADDKKQLAPITNDSKITYSRSLTQYLQGTNSTCQRKEMNH